MESNKKKGLVNLTKRTTAILSAALTALTGSKAIASAPITNGLLKSNTVEFKSIKSKPMSILKLNVNNPENSKFVTSHRSHSSHSSHRSHSSHYSGR